MLVILRDTSLTSLKKIDEQSNFLDGDGPSSTVGVDLSFFLSNSVTTIISSGHTRTPRAPAHREN